jgi:hypothetical protein
MKALGLSFSVFVLAALAAPPAEAGFHAFFHPSFHPSPGIGPSHGGGARGENGGRRSERGGGIGFYPASVGSDAAAATPPPQFVPVPFPVEVPYYMTRRTPSHPRLILIGHQTRPHGVLPEVVYGDPLPEETRRP